MIPMLQVLEHDMLQAGQEERQLAIDRGDFHQGIPAVTVICDGGWSKRSHKHSYDAMGGVAIIIGRETKKLMHIGIRNKNCYVCTQADTKHRDAPPHTCYKNWNQSSQAMEADIIVEGFKQAEAKHSLRYMRLIGDGDSSVFAKIRQEVAVWGKDVKKLECANHSVKCLRSALEKLVVEKPHYKRHLLTRQTRIRLTTAVRCAIRMRSKEKDRGEAIAKLRHDIANSIHHILGNHAKCSQDFCKVKQNDVQQLEPASTQPVNEPNQDEDALSENISMWVEGTTHFEMEESRGPSPLGTVTAENELLCDIGLLLQRLAEKADRLIENSTTNLAECWMSIRMKLDGGKVINRCNRGSWHARCFGGALRQNYGPTWSPTVWEQCTGVAATPLFHQHYSNITTKRANDSRNQKNPVIQARQRKRKGDRAKSSLSKDAVASYGPSAIDVTEDIPTAELTNKCEQFIITHFHKTVTECDSITAATLEQSASGLWRQERGIRLTSSWFGEIMSRRPTTPVAPIVKRILYPSFKGNMFTRYGLAAETSTRQEYILKKAESGNDVSVKQTGLVIDVVHQQLAASPDGIVTDKNSSDKGLIELKNVLQNKNINMHEAAKTISSFCLTLKGNKLALKRTHKYYFQCQGQLNICQATWLDFVVRCERPYQLHIERIYKDESLWNSTMLPKLLTFYQECMLPELTSPRNELVPGIREPPKPWVTIMVISNSVATYI